MAKDGHEDVTSFHSVTSRDKPVSNSNSGSGGDGAPEQIYENFGDDDAYENVGNDPIYENVFELKPMSPSADDDGFGEYANMEEVKLVEKKVVAEARSAPRPAEQIYQNAATLEQPVPGIEPTKHDTSEIPAAPLAEIPNWKEYKGPVRKSIPQQNSGPPQRPNLPLPIAEADPVHRKWKPMRGTLKLKLGALKSWQRRTAFLMKDRLDITREKNANQVVVERTINLHLIHEIYAGDDSSTFGITLTTGNDYIDFKAENTTERQAWILALHNTCLIQAIARRMSTDRVAYHLDNGADVDMIGPYLDDDEIPLLVACLQLADIPLVKTILRFQPKPYHLLARPAVKKLGIKAVYELMQIYNIPVNTGAIDQYGGTIIHFATEVGDEQLIQTILAKYRSIVNVGNAQGETPMMVAIRKNEMNLVSFFLKSGANVNVATKNGRTALHLACANRMKRLAFKLLYDHGATADILDANGRSVLHYALLYDMPDLATHIISQKGVDIDRQDSRGITPLMWALAKGPVFHNVAVLLIQQGADLKRVDTEGRSLLHLALAGNQVDIAYHLATLRSAVHDSVEKPTGNTPLFLACKMQITTLILQLLDRDCQVDIKNRAGLTPLMTYIESLRTRGADELEAAKRVIDAFCSRGVNLEEQSKVHGYAPIHFLLEAGHSALASHLLSKHTAQATYLTRAGRTCLHIALDVKTQESTALGNVIEELVTCGVDVNCYDHVMGSTALHKAILSRTVNRRSVNLLMTVCDATIWDSEGLSPFHYAVKLGNLKLVEDFVNKEVDLNHITESGRTPLFVAVSEGFNDVGALLVSKGADMRRVFPDTWDNLLHFALLHGREQMAEHILKNCPVLLLYPNAAGTTPYQMIHEKEDGQLYDLACQMYANFTDVEKQACGVPIRPRAHDKEDLVTYEDPLAIQ
eukprot:Clim_evm36s152 gene=Clim_evmTU36s152